MNSDDLTPDQCRQLRERIAPTVGYLSKLLTRMDRQRFPQDDVLRLQAKQAYEHLHHLANSLHYLTCRDQMGGKRRSK